MSVFVLAAENAPSNPILPDTNELVYSAIAFIVLVVVFLRIGFPLVKKAMNARTEKIRKDLSDAEKARNDAGAVLADYQAQLQDAKAESNRIIEEARQTADKMRSDLMAQAQREANDLKARNAEDIRAAQDRAMADLRANVSTLAVELAEKVVERNLDRETNLALIDNYINQVGTRA